MRRIVLAVVVVTVGLLATVSMPAAQSMRDDSISHTGLPSIAIRCRASSI